VKFVFASIYCRKTVPEGISLPDFAYSFSPLVEKTGADTVVLDIEGCELLFGSAYELVKDIAKRAARPPAEGGLGARVNVAVAANPDAALYASRFLKGVTFISPGEELTCLGDLPVKALLSPASANSPGLTNALDEKKRSQEIQEILETLSLWGVRTFRDFAALPSQGVSERLGQKGVKLQLLAAGKNNRHLNLIQASPVFETAIELEHAIAELEPLAFILARLLNQLCARLNEYALATNELRIHLKLEDGMSYERKLTLPTPMRDHKVFLKLLLLNTETHPPQSPVLAISVACEPVPPSLLQNGLFIPLAPEPEKLELTLARLARLVGANNIGSPELLDTNRPDAFRMKRFTLKEISRRKGSKKNKGSPQPAPIPTRKCISGFRVFRPPLRAFVETSHGCPLKISATDKTRKVRGKVVQFAGPWRTSGDWWRSDNWARDEWDVAVASRAGSANGEPIDGALDILYRVYRELSSGDWFVEGVYD
jgi:protein ImuB